MHRGKMPALDPNPRLLQDVQASDSVEWKLVSCQKVLRLGIGVKRSIYLLVGLLSTTNTTCLHDLAGWVFGIHWVKAFGRTSSLLRRLVEKSSHGYPDREYSSLARHAPVQERGPLCQTHFLSLRAV